MAFSTPLSPLPQGMAAPRPLPPPDEANREVLGLSFFPQQWRAVTAPVGPILVLAGPGAGKTRCLTGRIGYLLTALKADPARVCAITFTNKAAHEIASRLRAATGDLSGRMTLGTIHALCLEILRADHHRLGLPRAFGVADDAVMQLVLTRLGVPSKYQSGTLRRFGRHRLQGYKLTPQDRDLFGRYQRELRSNHLIDFDDIIHLTHLHLRDSSSVRERWQRRWDHVLIDEVQDLDETQYAILKLLADRHRSLFAVGDDEQSIFAWRGADPRVLAKLASDFAITDPILLDLNCRCPKPIFEAARKILPPAEPLFAKHITAVNDSPYPVRAVRLADDAAEVAWLVEDLKRDLATPGLRRGQVGVLYRKHDTGRLVEEALVAAGIPCQLARGQSLSEDSLIGRVLAALRVVLHPDSDLEVEHLAEKVLPEMVRAEVRRAAGATYQARLRAYAEQRTPDAKTAWRFLYQVENLKGLGRLHANLSDLVHAVLAQGVGEYENPLEQRHESLEDPEAFPGAPELADRLTAAEARRRRVLLPPSGGLEILARVMLQRVLPRLAVEYLEPGVTPALGDLVLNFGAADERLRVVKLFKALQCVEGRRYRKVFRDYVVFDTETTDLDVSACEVIELAAAKVRDGRVVETFHELIRCDRPIAAGATAIHGYTNEHLRGKPSLADVWARFRAFVGNEVLVLLGHNAHGFDRPVLERLTEPWDGMRGLAVFDTLPMARALLPTASLKLENLAARFGVPTGRAHHALDDTLCLAAVFERLQDERLKRSRKTCLPDLLDCVALGAAIEDVAPAHPEDAALLQAASWGELRRRPKVVDAYAEEAERRGTGVAPLEVLIQRLGGEGGWHGSRRPPTPQDLYPESYARLCRLAATVKAVALEDAIRELLDRAALSASQGAEIDPDRVSLLTLHATKGLEFDRVYLLGVEDMQLPGYHALQEDASEEEIHEARRLLYVGMTRARERLTLTCCATRGGRPSGGTRFLDEMGLWPVAPTAGPSSGGDQLPGT